MDTSQLVAHIHDRRLHELTIQEAAQEASQPLHPSHIHARPIEAPLRVLRMPLNITQFTDQLPQAFELISPACLQRYLRIWTETLEGMVAGAQDWSDLAASFTKLLLTCFKKGESISREVEHRLWYVEEGRVDELATYMKQRLLDYNGEQIGRRHARAQSNRHSRQGPISKRHSHSNHY